MSFTNDEDSFDDPSDFQADQFQVFDEHLRCPICKELFNATMILNTCSHSFCALCIRRSLSTEQICPKCRKPAFENNLIHNYDLDNVVHSWRESRSYFLKLDEGINKPSTPVQQPNGILHEETVIEPVPEIYQQNHCASMVLDDDETDDFKPNTSPTFTSNMPATRRSTRLSSQSPGKALQEPSDITPMQPVKTLRSNLSMQPQASQSSSASTPRLAIDKLEESSVVQCPVCSKCMQYNVLDIHIDRCLNGDSRIPPSPSINASASSSKSVLPNAFSPLASYSPKMNVPNTPKRPKAVDLGRKPTKQVYAMMKDKELKQTLKSLNLSDQGDRQQMIWRHKEYLNLYNANYDSQNPVSANVLIQRLHIIEASHMNDKYSKSKRKAANPEEHKTKYADQFSFLIENARKRKYENQDDHETSKKKES